MTSTLSWGLAVALLAGVVLLALQERRGRLLREERALRERAEGRLRRAQALLSSIPDVLMVIEPDERISELKLTTRPGGSSPLPRLEGERLADWFDANALEPLRRARALAISTSQPQTLELPLRLFDAARFYDTRVAMLEGSTVVVLMRDVTERHVTARALEQARKAADEMTHARAELLARVGDDLHGAVTSVGIADLWPMRGEPLDEHVRRYLEVVERSSERLFVLLDDVIDFTRIEQSKLSLRREPTDPVALVSDVVALFEPEATRHGTRLALHVGKGLPERMLLEPERTRQIVTNLVAQAVSFTQQGRVHVHVDVDAEHHVVVITVSDTGTRIAPEALPHLFDAFVEREGDGARRERGSGLALAITRQLVEALGGTITAESTAGQGTTFRVRLPELSASAVPELTGASAPRES